MFDCNCISWHDGVLDELDAEKLARAIRATEWDDENIADAARISTHVNLVTQARERALREVTADQQIAFYRLLTFLGISSDGLAC